MTRREVRPISERLFQQFCDDLAIPCQPIATAHEQGEKRPDFEITLPGTPVIVEVKQFNANRQEKLEHARMERGEIFVRGTTPGERLTSAISDAGKQLKAYSEHPYPALLVVYNNVAVTSQHVDPYAVATAMRGLDEIPIEVPADRRKAPKAGATRSGSRRGMSTQHNKTISAIAVLRTDFQDQLHLLVYHNSFAARPLDPELWRHPRVTDWRIPKDSRSSLDGWEAC